MEVRYIISSRSIGLKKHFQIISGVGEEEIATEKCGKREVGLLLT